MARFDVSSWVDRAKKYRSGGSATPSSKAQSRFRAAARKASAEGSDPEQFVRDSGRTSSGSSKDRSVVRTQEVIQPEVRIAVDLPRG